MLVLHRILPLEKQIYYLLLRSGIRLINQPFHFLLRAVESGVLGAENPILVVSKDFSHTQSRIVQGIGRALAQAKEGRPEWLDFISGGPVDERLNARGLVDLMVKWFDTHMVVELDNAKHAEPYEFRFVEITMCKFF